MQPTFKAMILSSKNVLFEGSAHSVFLPGDDGEFEVLAFHKAIISLLKQGNIVINGEKSIVISKGVVKVNDNGLVALVEE